MNIKKLIKKWKYDWRFYSWKSLLILSLLFSFIFTVQIFSFYGEKSEYAVDEGKRLIYFIKDEKLVQRDAEEEYQEGDVKYNTNLNINNSPKLAILINNVGLIQSISDAVIALPSEVGVAITPYANNIENLAKSIKSRNHEIYLDIPMETEDYPFEDNGEQSLLHLSGAAKNIFRLKKMFDDGVEFSGIATPANEKMTHSQTNMIAILDELKDKDLIFIYNERLGNEYLPDEAKSVGVPIIKKYILIDEVLTKAAIEHKLEEVRKMIIEERKQVLIVGRPYPLTIKTIDNWLKNTVKDSFKLAPVSHLSAVL